jgi:hypothetical protein
MTSVTVTDEMVEKAQAACGDVVPKRVMRAALEAVAPAIARAAVEADRAAVMDAATSEPAAKAAMVDYGSDWAPTTDLDRREHYKECVQMAGAVRTALAAACRAVDAQPPTTGGSDGPADRAARAQPEATTMAQAVDAPVAATTDEAVAGIESASSVPRVQLTPPNAEAGEPTVCTLCGAVKTSANEHGSCDDDYAGGFIPHLWTSRARPRAPVVAFDEAGIGVLEAIFERADDGVSNGYRSGLVAVATAAAEVALAAVDSQADGMRDGRGEHVRAAIAEARRSLRVSASVAAVDHLNDLRQIATSLGCTMVNDTTRDPEIDARPVLLRWIEEQARDLREAHGCLDVVDPDRCTNRVLRLDGLCVRLRRILPPISATVAPTCGAHHRDDPSKPCVLVPGHPERHVDENGGRWGEALSIAKEAVATRATGPFQQLDARAVHYTDTMDVARRAAICGVRGDARLTSSSAGVSCIECLRLRPLSVSPPFVEPAPPPVSPSLREEVARAIWKRRQPHAEDRGTKPHWAYEADADAVIPIVQRYDVARFTGPEAVEAAARAMCGESLHPAKWLDWSVKANDALRAAAGAGGGNDRAMEAWAALATRAEKAEAMLDAVCKVVDCIHADAASVVSAKIAGYLQANMTLRRERDEARADYHRAAAEAALAAPAEGGGGVETSGVPMNATTLYTWSKSDNDVERVTAWLVRTVSALASKKGASR